MLKKSIANGSIILKLPNWKLFKILSTSTTRKKKRFSLFLNRYHTTTTLVVWKRWIRFHRYQILRQNVIKYNVNKKMKKFPNCFSSYSASFYCKFFSVYFYFNEVQIKNRKQYWYVWLSSLYKYKFNCIINNSGKKLLLVFFSKFSRSFLLYYIFWSRSR